MDLQQNLKEKQGNLKHLIQIRKPELLDEYVNEKNIHQWIIMQQFEIEQIQKKLEEQNKCVV